MLKRLSLRMRLTLLSAVLLTICCVGLTCVINLSAYKMADGIGTVVPAMPAVSSSVAENENAETEFVSPIASADISARKKAFSLQSILYMLFAILGGSALTYYVSGKALKPLQALNTQVKNITVQNLSESLPVPPTKDEIAELTQSFNEMTDKLELSFERQKRFAANAAHELRTPLAVLQTKLDVFKKKSVHETEDYENIIATFDKQTARLRALIKVLLDMTNMNDDLEQDTVNLRDVLEDIAAELTPFAEKQNITLQLNCDDCKVMGNLDLLYRAFYNLVENAIRYNKENGSVTMEAKQVADRKAEIIISDTGIGIPDDMKKQIFEPFFRVDKSRSRAMGGAGLGLSVVKQIMDKHNGSIIITDSEDGGSCFKIVL